MRGTVCKKLRKLASMVGQDGNKKGFIKDTMRKMVGKDKDGKFVDYEWGTVSISGPHRIYKNMKKAIKNGYPLKQIESDVHGILVMRKRTADGQA